MANLAVREGNAHALSALSYWSANSELATPSWLMPTLDRRLT
jgi:hypothetical protein